MTAPVVRAGEPPSLAVDRLQAAKRSVLPLSVLLGFLIFWQLLAVLDVVPDFLLPTATEILATLGSFIVEVATGGPAAEHFLTTLSEIVIGFVISVVLGVAIGTLMNEFKFVSQAFYPYVVAFDSTPKVAVAPLFVIWFGFGQMSKIAMVVAIATFPVVINTLAGLQATKPEELRLLRSLGANRRQMFVKLRMRNAMPFFFAGLELAITGASIGAVVGEFSGGNKGLGYLTLRAQEMFQLPEAFATIALLAIQGILLHRFVIWVRNRVVFWDTEAARL